MVRLITNTPNPEEMLAGSFAKCYQSEPKIEVVAKFLKHQSVLEHVSFTFDIKCSRLTHTQIVRHRLASYTSQSHRYTEMTEEDTYIYVPTEISSLPHEMQMEWGDDCKDAFAKYRKWRDRGVKRETARYLINDGVGINFRMTINLRSLMNFLTLRLDAHAQEEIRAIAQEMKNLAFDTMPKLAPYLDELIIENQH